MLLSKYNVSVPRYTSYPPANYFGGMDGADWAQHIERSNGQGSRHVSFYLHMPYCRRLCHYCGCNSYLMPQDAEAVQQYVEAVHREIELVAAHLDRTRPISQIHYGGGSPTALPIPVLRELNEHLLSLFPTIDQPEIAIECHPGYLRLGDWQALCESGFNRFSIGVQDRDEQVLQAVGRVPSAEPLGDIMSVLREAGATVNLDFLYGLPYQTPESVARNIEQAIALRPDRLVTFSYGHVPWVFKRQQVLERLGLPAPELKQQMADRATALLHEAGYKSIGLDHFVLPTDELYSALQQGLLYRNFQGYCTRRTTGQVYALGVTGISQLHDAYAQNTKDIAEYIAEVSAGRLPVRKGYYLSPQECIAKEVIERLMCNYSLRWSEIAASLQLSVADVIAALHYDEAQLREMEGDGILTLWADGLEMTAEGHPYVRNVCAALDKLMVHTDKQFSKPL